MGSLGDTTVAVVTDAKRKPLKYIGCAGRSDCSAGKSGKFVKPLKKIQPVCGHLL
jgi:hypothetical protein